MVDKKVRLAGREYTKNRFGDPEFRDLEDLRTQFEDWEIVELVTRQIKMALTANESNKKRMARIREMERPVREAARRLWPEKSFSDLSTNEYQRAVMAAYPDHGTGESMEECIGDCTAHNVKNCTVDRRSMEE